MPSGFTLKRPDFKAEFAKVIAEERRKQKQVSRIVVDKVSREAQRLIREEMAAAGLGKLGQGVRQEVGKSKKTGNYYGLIYAAGGDESRTGGALDAYTNGTTITAKNKRWLAIATDAIPKFYGRKRMDPLLYVLAGLDHTIGPLHFVPVNAKEALLVARSVNQHVRTGRIKARGARKSRVYAPAKEVVCFVLIRFTFRAQRINRDALCQAAVEAGPGFAAEAYASIA